MLHATIPTKDKKMKTRPVKFTPRIPCDEPAAGSIGISFRAPGFYDPESASYEAWLFEPSENNPERNAYYCAFDDLTFSETILRKLPIIAD